RENRLARRHDGATQMASNQELASSPIPHTTWRVHHQGDRNAKEGNAELQRSRPCSPMLLPPDLDGSTISYEAKDPANERKGIRVGLGKGDRTMALPLPRNVIAKRLTNGKTGFYFNIQSFYRKLGCPVSNEALGTDYGIACGSDGNGGRAAA